MDLRIALATPLLLAFSLPAQELEPQDPNRQIEELVRERARLEQEIRYTQERVKQSKSLLQRKLAGANPKYREIDAGVPASMIRRPATPSRKFARVATPEELARYPDGTMIIVDNRSIGQAYFDRVMDYMKSSGIPGDANMHAQRVLFDMIRLEAIAADMLESEGESKVGEALAHMQQGGSIADLIKKHGTVRGADAEGLVEVRRNSVYGPFFEHHAFGTEPGKFAGPFRSPHGFVLLQVDSIEKGEKFNQDIARCRVAQIDYTSVPQKLQKAQMKVNQSQVEVLARDEEVLKMLPQLFRKVEARPPQTAIERLHRQEQRCSELLDELEQTGKGDSEEADRLRQTLQQLRKAMADLDQTDSKKAEKAKLKAAAEKARAEDAGDGDGH